MTDRASFRLHPNSAKGSDLLHLAIEGFDSPETAAELVGKECKIEFYEVDGRAKSAKFNRNDDLLAEYTATIEERGGNPMTWGFADVKRVDTFESELPARVERKVTDSEGTETVLGYQPDWRPPYFVLNDDLGEVKGMGPPDLDVVLIRGAAREREKYVYSIAVRILVDGAEWFSSRRFPTRLECHNLIGHNCKEATVMMLEDHQELVDKRGVGTNYGSKFEAPDLAVLREQKAKYGLTSSSCIVYLLEACARAHEESLAAADWKAIKRHMKDGTGTTPMPLSPTTPVRPPTRPGFEGAPWARAPGSSLVAGPGDPLEQTGQAVNGTFRIVEAEPGQVVREREHRALGGEVMVARVDVLGCGGEQEAGDDYVDGLREDFLANAESRLGVELTLVEVDRLLELEEFLRLPAQVVELGDLGTREVRATQRGQVERLVATGVEQLDRAELDGLAAATRIVGRRDQHAVVVPAALAEDLDRLERLGRRDPDEEVDLVIQQDAQDLVGRVAAIEHEHIAGAQDFEVVEQHLPLAGGIAIDHHVARNLGHDVHERTHGSHRDVTSFGSTEAGVEFGAPLQVDLAPIDGEYATVVPSRRAGERGLHLARGAVQDVSQQIARQLAARLAERRRRHRLVGRQRHAVGRALVPEQVEDVPVAAAIAVASHEQQQHYEQVRCQLAVATEVARPAPQPWVASCRENLGNEAKNLPRIESLALRLRRYLCAIHLDFHPGIHNVGCATSLRFFIS